MKTKRIVLCWAYAVLLIFGVEGAYGELIDRGNGLVADTVLGITWMQDGSLFETLCEANDPIASNFVPVFDENSRIICYQDGGMSLFDANAWIDRLNEVKYKGYSDWRLPVVDIEPYPEVCSTDCSNNEILHLIYVTLGNFFDSVEPCDTYVVQYTWKEKNCIKNRGPFYNIQSVYWTGTVHPIYGDYMFILPETGRQESDNPENRSNVWPVRDGLSPLLFPPPSRVSRQANFLK